MSFFSGYDFFVCLVMLLIPAIIIGLCEKSLKWYRWIVSLFFIWKVYGNTPIQLCYLIFYVVLSAILVKVYLHLRNKYGRNVWIYRCALALALFPLVAYKLCTLCGYSVFGFLGISYICFRIIQVIIEEYDGVITEIKILRFVEFLIFFASLSSGPIDRSRCFNADDDKVWNRDEYIELLYTGVYKLVLGVFYKVVCSAIAYDILQQYFIGNHSFLHLIGRAYVYGFYLFFDFAGYSAMAVGTSYILGIKMPDNFNKPFLSVDIKDFWNRWHISLSSWFRDFIFSRFIIDATRKKLFKNRLTCASVGLILNMFIMGLWHGLESHYIAYGLYHGVIMAITEVYQKKSGFYKKNKRKKWYIGISWFVNINVVMLGFLIFSGYVNEAIKLILEK